VIETGRKRTDFRQNGKSGCFVPQFEGEILALDWVQIGAVGSIYSNIVVGDCLRTGYPKHSERLGAGATGPPVAPPRETADLVAPFSKPLSRVEGGEPKTRQ
jgi:hypothetical protein